MQVTLGDEGSGFSKLAPRFLPAAAGNIGDWPPRRLPLVRRRRLREVERETGAARPGLWIVVDLEEIFMEEEEERREVKQMKSSLERWGLSAESIIALLRPFTATEWKMLMTFLSRE